MKRLKILINLTKYQIYVKVLKKKLKLTILKILNSTLKNLMKVYFQGLTLIMIAPIMSVSITTQLNYNLFVDGSKNMGLLVALKKEKQYAMINLLTFLKIRNIKIASAQKIK